MSTILLLTIVVLFLIYSYFKRQDKKLSTGSPEIYGKELPGPWSIPLIGYLPMFFAKHMYTFLNDLSSKYGPIFKIQLGSRTIVVLNSLPLIRNAFSESAFTDRPDIPSLRAIRTDGRFHRQIFMQGNDQWKFYRKNSIKALALFGSSKNSRLQAVVEQGCRSLHADFDKNLDKPYNPNQSIFECVACIIGSINFGLHFDREDPLMKEIVEFTEKIVKALEVASVVDYFPIFEWLLFYKLERIRNIARPISDLVTQHLEKHEHNTENVADIADALYKRSLEITPEEYEAIQLTPQHLQQAAQDLFMAGFSTIMETFRWGLAFMAKYPAVQQKIHEELEQVFGCDEDARFPCADDRSSTPYIEATILEIFRLSSFVPLSLPHATTHELSFEGYHLPSGVIVVPNLWAVHHNEETFPNNEIFRPERFLNESGCLDTDLAQNVVPFSVGKRRCIGENLARQEVYLLFTATMHRYDVSFPKNDAKCIDFEKNVIEGVGRMVKPLDFVLHRRF